MIINTRTESLKNSNNTYFNQLKAGAMSGWMGGLWQVWPTWSENSAQVWFMQARSGNPNTFTDESNLRQIPTCPFQLIVFPILIRS